MPLSSRMTCLRVPTSGRVLGPCVPTSGRPLLHDGVLVKALVVLSIRLLGTVPVAYLFWGHVGKLYLGVR